MSDKAERLSDDEAVGLGRRELLAYAAAFGTTFLAGQGLLSRAGAAEVETKPKAKHPAPRRRYAMKKSINLWAFPYPDKMSLAECFELAADAGFDAVEINYALEGDLAPDATPSKIEQIGRLARKKGIAISGVCSFLFWPYSMTHNDPKRRNKGIKLALKMIEAARLLETENLLVVPGAVYVPWLPDEAPVPNDVCDRRAREAIYKLLPAAEKAGVLLNIENIFASGYLFSPKEMIDFVDSFRSPAVQVHFDTGNVMQYQFPEHWIPLLGKRIKNVHLKEWDKRQSEFSIDTFRTMLDGTVDWPAVIEALDGVGYRGYLTFEYFHPFAHHPEALVYHTSDAMDRLLGRK